eukprot:363581-Chlamydomonas_euryale.AAC.3
MRHAPCAHRARHGALHACRAGLVHEQQDILQTDRERLPERHICTTCLQTFFWRESSASSRAALLPDRCPGQSQGQSRCVASLWRLIAPHCSHYRPDLGVAFRAADPGLGTPPPRLFSRDHAWGRPIPNANPYFLVPPTVCAAMLLLGHPHTAFELLAPPVAAPCPSLEARLWRASGEHSLYSR